MSNITTIILKWKNEFKPMKNDFYYLKANITLYSYVYIYYGNQILEINWWFSDYCKKKKLF